MSDDELTQQESAEVEAIAAGDTDDEGTPRGACADGRPQYEALMGTAGTGKTFQAREIVRAHPGKVELCATTGIAAVNLGAGVTTLNSLIGFFDTASLRDLWVSGKLTRKLGRLLSSGTRRLVIDEMSMMDGEQLEILVQACEELAKDGGTVLGLTLVGDFCQLPPVKARFCFEVDAFEKFRPNITKLTEIRRQSDKDFIEALQAVRRGDRVRALEFFADKVERTLDQDFPGATLLAKNDEVDRYNLMKHAQVRGELLQYQSRRWGMQRSEWKQIPDTLGVKVGSLVMVLANEREMVFDEAIGRSYPTGNYLYVNGDLGEVVGVGGLGFQVKKQRDGKVVDVLPVTREYLVPCDSARRKELRANDPEKLRGEDEQWEALGAVTYMPLRLAWATSVHKSQGLSLDQVQLSIANHMWEMGGMCYVALSRARTAAGLRLVGSKELLAKRIVTDPRVREWL